MKPRHQMVVFGFFFALYMFSTSREIPWNDAHLIYHTAGAMTTRGELGVPVAGAPGTYTYAPHPLLPAVSQVPGWIIYNWIVARWLVAWSMAKVMTSHLGPAFFGALTCVLFLNTALLLGISRKVASFCTLAVGLATGIWVYARSPYSEIVQAAPLMGYIGALLAFWKRPRGSAAFRVGFWGALLVNAKVVFVLSLPAALAFCLYRLRHDLKSFFKYAIFALVPVLLGAAVVLAHNRVRTGEVTNTGYGVAAAVFSQPLWEGAWGLLASPGKSLFLFAPPLLASLWAWQYTRKSYPHLLWLLAGTLVPVFYVYAKFEAWSGDWAWGPRYLVPLMPPLLLPAAVWVNDLVKRRGQLKLSRLRYAPVLALFVTGIGVQILGNAFYWDHYIRISQEVRNNWLGNPNRTGSKGVPRPTGCDPCFEDFYPFQWLPPFQQIHGHLWMLRTVPKKMSWMDAAAVAPWTNYTNLIVPIERSYPQARIDWWPLQFWPRFKEATASLFALFSFGTLACAVLWWRACRTRLPRKKAPRVRDAAALTQP